MDWFEGLASINLLVGLSTIAQTVWTFTMGEALLYEVRVSYEGTSLNGCWTISWRCHVIGFVGPSELCPHHGLCESLRPCVFSIALLMEIISFVIQWFGVSERLRRSGSLRDGTFPPRGSTASLAIQPQFTFSIEWNSMPWHEVELSSSGCAIAYPNTR
jgi:hypothetical protein